MLASSTAFAPSMRRRWRWSNSARMLRHSLGEATGSFLGLLGPGVGSGFDHPGMRRQLADEDAGVDIGTVFAEAAKSSGAGVAGWKTLYNSRIVVNGFIAWTSGFVLTHRSSPHPVPVTKQYRSSWSAKCPVFAYGRPWSGFFRPGWAETALAP
jgi:hypothetical protein